MTNQQQQTHSEIRGKDVFQQIRQPLLPSLHDKVILGVYSGKGGVGKTTIAVNLAGILAKKYSVCVIDLDIDAPNVPRLLGLEGKLIVNDKTKQYQPLEYHNPLYNLSFGVISLAFFLEHPDEPIVWRGPLLTKAVHEIMHLTDFSSYDLLILDLPPGTSDVPLTVMQILPVDGFLIIATPHPLGIMDAKKSIKMIKKLKKPILGIIENMTGILGEAGAERIAKEEMIPYLGTIPFEKDLVQHPLFLPPFYSFQAPLEQFYEQSKKR